MKKLSLLGTALAVSMLLLAGCGEKKHEGNHGHEHEMEEKATEEVVANNISFKEEKAGEIFQHYIHVKTALVNSDADEAANGAKMIVASIGEADGSAEISAAAKSISETSDIKEQRAAFADLSAAVEEAVEGQLTSGAVYKQYCPMAFNNKGGYWLSDQEGIRNPYFGDKMLKCGRVEKVMGEL
ncbi:DUF3347 domain-containing protein [Echinicola sp. 20G]|uniref:DUF3347 domain-containing protein n=1 Tax=Echinicola sp. 20G TaxID=2781961 RepID=UPI00190FD712|nr:DUF3347 domain-containing protein [Echinicola sp. 20G]